MEIVTMFPFTLTVSIYTPSSQTSNFGMHERTNEPKRKQKNSLTTDESDETFQFSYLRPHSLHLILR